MQQNDAVFESILFSDEATFTLYGEVNTQNIRRYAPFGNKTPQSLKLEKPTFSSKIMVFCGLRLNGTFGLRFFRNQAIDGTTYHSLLQYRVFPELRNTNGGSLDNLYWMQGDF